MSDTRQDILDAALVLFSEQGYDKTSLREIAEQVGVTKAALYYHFRSKQDILLALFEPIATMQDQLLAQLRDGAFRDREAWLPALEGILGVILSNRLLWALLEHNAPALMALESDGEFVEAHRELHTRTEEFFADGGLPIEARVRLACAFGAVLGMVDVGGALVFGDTPSAELKPMVLEVVRDILAPIVAATPA